MATQLASAFSTEGPMPGMVRIRISDSPITLRLVAVGNGPIPASR